MDRKIVVFLFDAEETGHEAIWLVLNTTDNILRRRVFSVRKWGVIKPYYSILVTW